jgi:hypothetical protein
MRKWWVAGGEWLGKVKQILRCALDDMIFWRRQDAEIEEGSLRYVARRAEERARKRHWATPVGMTTFLCWDVEVEEKDGK